MIWFNVDKKYEGIPLIWTSSNSDIAFLSVENGLINCINTRKPGNAIITVSLADGSGIIATCSITVLDSITENFSVSSSHSSNENTDSTNNDSSGLYGYNYDDAASILGGKGLVSNLISNDITFFDQFNVFFRDWKDMAKAVVNQGYDLETGEYKTIAAAYANDEERAVQFLKSAIENMPKKTISHKDEKKLIKESSNLINRISQKFLDKYPQIAIFGYDNAAITEFIQMLLVFQEEQSDMLTDYTNTVSYLHNISDISKGTKLQELTDKLIVRYEEETAQSIFKCISSGLKSYEQLRTAMEAEKYFKLYQESSGHDNLQDYIKKKIANPNSNSKITGLISSAEIYSSWSANPDKIEATMDAGLNLLGKMDFGPAQRILKADAIIQAMYDVSDPIFKTSQRTDALKKVESGISVSSTALTQLRNIENKLNNDPTNTKLKNEFITSFNFTKTVMDTLYDNMILYYNANYETEKVARVQEAKIDLQSQNAMTYLYKKGILTH